MSVLPAGHARVRARQGVLLEPLNTIPLNASERFATAVARMGSLRRRLAGTARVRLSPFATLAACLATLQCSNAGTTQAVTKLQELEARIAEQEKVLATLRAAIPQVHPTWTRISVGSTGNETCGEAGLACIAVKPSPAFDLSHRFCGYTIADCNARFVARPGCSHHQDGTVANYALAPVRFVRAPKVPGSCSVDNDAICMYESSYDSAMCIDPSETSPPEKSHSFASASSALPQGSASAAVLQAASPSASAGVSRPYPKPTP
jgi:hypothetical protein